RPQPLAPNPFPLQRHASCIIIQHRTSVSRRRTMDNTYGEFQGTELDPALDYDFDDDEINDLVPILALAAGFAALVGAFLLLIGRRKQPTTADRAQEMLEIAQKQGKKGMKQATKAVADAKLGKLLDEAIERAQKVGSDADLTGLLEDARAKVGHALAQADVSGMADGARRRAAVASVGLSAMLDE